MYCQPLLQHTRGIVQACQTLLGQVSSYQGYTEFLHREPWRKNICSGIIRSKIYVHVQRYLKHFVQVVLYTKQLTLMSVIFIFALVPCGLYACNIQFTIKLSIYFVFDQLKLLHASDDRIQIVLSIIFKSGQFVCGCGVKHDMKLFLLCF